jgi:cytochrome c peroxidase
MRGAGLALTLAFAACGPEGDGSGFAAALCAPVLPATRYGYTDADAPIPAHFRSSIAGTVAFSDNTPATNRITNAGAELGRVLFYDPRLSAGDRIACASCHRQASGFGDTARFSAGARGGHRPRHTMALANARFNDGGRFFWDERGSSLEHQVLEPIRDTVEMGMELGGLERKLGATAFYPGLFAAAFGSPAVTRDRIAAALAQFVRSLISGGSRFDAAFLTGGAPDFSVLTREEQEGFRLFNAAGCANCHRTIAQFADKASNTGLDTMAADTGAGEGRFKPPSLRNIAVRPPYMHDGRFPTLRAVVEFYSRSVQDSRFLDPRLRGADGLPRRLNLTPAQVGSVVAFLESLTDTAFLHADRFADPFPCHARGRRS